MFKVLKYRISRKRVQINYGFRLFIKKLNFVGEKTVLSIFGINSWPSVFIFVLFGTINLALGLEVNMQSKFGTLITQFNFELMKDLK